MPSSISIEDITNESGTGIFDKLMVAVNTNIDLQFQQNRITGNDYANVYLGSIQSAMSQSMQFVLQEQLAEAQVDTARADIDVKERLTASELLTRIEQRAQIVADVDTKERLTVSELDNAFTDRVIKDKQAAKLGLDNVMKNSEGARLADPNYIYTPNYEDS